MFVYLAFVLESEKSESKKAHTDRAVKSTLECHTSAVTYIYMVKNCRNGESPWGGSTEKWNKRAEEAQISFCGR